jgi:hypothetical protein
MRNEYNFFPSVLLFVKTASWFIYIMYYVYRQFFFFFFLPGLRVAHGSMKHLVKSHNLSKTHPAMLISGTGLDQMSGAFS